MANALTKIKLSGSTDGKPILITGTATGSANTLHTAIAGTTTGSYDEIWLYFCNTSTSDVLLTVEFGDSTSTNTIKYTVLGQDGLKCVVPGLVLQNGAVVKAFAATGSVINCMGFANQIAHT